MKNTRILIPIVAVMILLNVSSCIHPFPGDHCLRGSGQVVYEEIDVDVFNSVISESVVDVEIVQGDEQSVAIEGYANMIDYLNVTVYNNELSIDMQKGCYTNIGLKVFITTPDIEEVAIKGTGSIVLGGFEDLTALDVFIKGTGSVYGDGSITIDEHLYIESNGVGKVEMEVYTNEVIAYLEGTGSVNLTGSCSYQYVEVGGTGSYRSFYLDSDYCEAYLHGVGRAEVFVVEELDATINGVGSVFYMGNPRVKVSDTGVGDLVYVD